MNRQRLARAATFAVIAAFLFMFCIVAAGCQQHTPAQQVIEARGAYTLAMKGLIAARDAGQISDADARWIDKVREVADAAINRAAEAAKAGNKLGTEDALRIAEDAIDKLLQWWAANAAPKSKATTKPTATRAPDWMLPRTTYIYPSYQPV